MANKVKCKDTEKINKLGSHFVGLSKLLLFHRPSEKTLKLLKDLKGVTMVITAQAKSECPEDVAKLCQQFDIKHFHIELNGANKLLKMDQNTIEGVRKRVKECFTELQSTKHVAVLHCARGVHRTGTVAYTLLRLGGLGKLASFESLKTMREETYKGVGDKRIKFAEDELIPYIANQMTKKGVEAEVEEAKDLKVVAELFGAGEKNIEDKSIQELKDDDDIK